MGWNYTRLILVVYVYSKQMLISVEVFKDSIFAWVAFCVSVVGSAVGICRWPLYAGGFSMQVIRG